MVADRSYYQRRSSYHSQGSTSAEPFVEHQPTHPPPNHHHIPASENQLIYNTGAIIPGYAAAAASAGGEDGGRRPKPVFFWTAGEVMKWLRRHCEQFYDLYGNCFLEHEITGRTLVRLTHSTLQRMGVDCEEHRDEIVRTILKLKLKSDIIELKEIQRRIPDPSAGDSEDINGNCEYDSIPASSANGHNNNGHHNQNHSQLYHPQQQQQQQQTLNDFNNVNRNPS